MDKIILIGAGGHARACIDVIEQEDRFKIAGLIEKDAKKGIENLGYPIIGADGDLQNLRQKYSYALITVGQIKSSITRVKLFQQLQEMDYILPVVISPRAYTSKHVQIGDGTIILHDVIVNANAKVGKNCIINNKALVEHDTIVGDHCHISTGAIVNGEVTVGEGSFIANAELRCPVAR